MNELESVIWSDVIAKAEEAMYGQNDPKQAVGIPAHVLLAVQKDISSISNLINQVKILSEF